jgi:hypothetical protein
MFIFVSIRPQSSQTVQLPQNRLVLPLKSVSSHSLWHSDPWVVSSRKTTILCRGAYSLNIQTTYSQDIRTMTEILNVDFPALGSNPNSTLLASPLWNCIPCYGTHRRVIHLKIILTLLSYESMRLTSLQHHAWHLSTRSIMQGICQHGLVRMTLSLSSASLHLVGTNGAACLPNFMRNSLLTGLTSRRLSASCHPASCQLAVTPPLSTSCHPRGVNCDISHPPRPLEIKSYLEAIETFLFCKHVYCICTYT